MKNLNLIYLHYTSKEDWYVNVDAISAIRVNHDSEDKTGDGVWVYLKGDSQPIKVTETFDEILERLKGLCC